MVLTSGFTSTPTTRLLILLYTTLSILATLTSTKHLLPIRPTPHLWPYLQFTRTLTFQSACTTSTDLLFTVVLLYTFRPLERLWGTRKYTSFVILALLLCAPLTVVLGITLSALTLGRWNYIPAGLTGLVFAALANYTAEVPAMYRWRVLLPSTGGGSGAAGDNNNTNNDESGSGNGTRSKKSLQFSDKSTTYLLAAQLALSQFPYNLLPAGVGWVVGTAWAEEMLPVGMGRWRVKGWVVGEGRRDQERKRYEGLRRRLDEEGDDGMRQSLGQGRGQGGAEGGGGGGSATAAEDAGRGRTGVVGQARELLRGVF